MSRLPRARYLLLALTGSLALTTASASAANVVVEDWHGATGNAWQQGAANDFIGWASASSDGTFNFAKTDLTGRASLLAEAQFLPQQAPGTGEWRFTAPGTSTITKAEYGAAYFTKEGCLNEGMRLASGAWQPTRNARLGDSAATSVHPTACGANATVTGAPVTTKDGTTAVTITGAPGRQTFCSTAGCGIAASPIGNRAVFGAERIKQGRPGFAAVLPGARLTLTDYDAPKLTAGTNTHPRWVRTARGSITVTATDTGLGVKSATVTHAALTGDATTDQTHPCLGDRTDRCPATWNQPRPDWTTNWPYDTDQMPEGIQPYGAAAQDIVDNRAPATGYDTTLIPPSKIDRSDPTSITGTGQIPDLDGKWFLGNDTRTIDVAAHDTYSGVQTIQVEKTDGTILDETTFDCSDDQCPRDVTKTLAVDTTRLPEGITVVRVRATDLVGNTATSGTWQLKIDRSDPTGVTGAGQVPTLDGKWFLGNDTRTIDVAAHDTYSGVQTIQVEKTDGTILDKATLDCSNEQCPRDVTKTLAVDTTRLPEGVTTVRVRATDLVGHTSTSSSWQLKIDRSDPTIDSIDGSLIDAGASWVQARDRLDLTVRSRDGYSGVLSAQVATSDGAILASADNPCAASGCPGELAAALSFDAGQLPEGITELVITVSDQLNHLSRRSTVLRIDRTAPTVSSGPVDDLAAGDVLPSATVTATDGGPAATSGVRTISAAVRDGAAFADSTSSCTLDCDRTRTADFGGVSLAGLPEGVLASVASATDAAGNQATADAWDLTVDRTAPQFESGADFDVAMDGGGGSITFDEPDDATLVVRYEVSFNRYGQWEPASASEEPTIGFTGSPPDQISVVAVDEVGNRSAATVLAASATEPGGATDVTIPESEEDGVSVPATWSGAVRADASGRVDFHLDLGDRVLGVEPDGSRAVLKGANGQVEVGFDDPVVYYGGRYYTGRWAAGPAGSLRLVIPTSLRNKRGLRVEFVPSPVRTTTYGARSAAPYRFITIPTWYVYDPDTDTDPTLHDYCSYVPDKYKDADFRGPCARHDLCYAALSDRDPRRGCNKAFLSDLLANCRFFYDDGTKNRRKCDARARYYYDGVRIKNP